MDDRSPAEWLLLCIEEVGKRLRGVLSFLYPSSLFSPQDRSEVFFSFTTDAK